MIAYRLSLTFVNSWVNLHLMLSLTPVNSWVTYHLMLINFNRQYVAIINVDTTVLKNAFLSRLKNMIIFISFPSSLLPSFLGHVLVFLETSLHSPNLFSLDSHFSIKTKLSWLTYYLYSRYFIGLNSFHIVSMGIGNMEIVNSPR